MATVPAKKQSGLKGKGGWIAAGAVVVLGIWLALDMKHPVREPDTAPPVSDYVHLMSDDVKRVEVKRGTDGFVLARQGDKWKFQSPGQYPASEESVKSWLENLLEKATVSQETHAKPGPATWLSTAWTSPPPSWSFLPAARLARSRSGSSTRRPLPDTTPARRRTAASSSSRPSRPTT